MRVMQGTARVEGVGETSGDCEGVKWPEGTGGERYWSFDWLGAGDVGAEWLWRVCSVGPLVESGLRGMSLDEGMSRRASMRKRTSREAPNQSMLVCGLSPTVKERLLSYMLDVYSLERDSS